MPKRGFFISFEGPEGAGKSTHARLLTSWLKQKGHPVTLTREPGGTAMGARLRQLLLHEKKADALDPMVELCLYQADRALHVTQVIRPALQKGKVVIVDRFQDSTWVYQGWAGGMDLKLIEAVGSAVTGDARPDLTFFLDVPVTKGLARVRKPNRFEAKPVSFHQKVRQGFHHLAKKESKRFRVIRVNQPVQQVQEIIRKAVADAIC